MNRVRQEIEEHPRKELVMNRNRRSYSSGVSALALLAALVAPVSASAAAAKDPAPDVAGLVALYVPIQEELAADSVLTVREKAAKLAAAASAAGESAKEVAAAARAMNGTRIDDLREQFKELSTAVARLVEGNAVDGHGIYYCPMAGAYWVQKKGEVANPYYGEEMLRCGAPAARVES